MKIYWYAPWPDDRAWVSLSLAQAVAGDSARVVLHILQGRSGSSRTVDGNVEVVANLPGPSPARPWTARWLIDRLALVTRRAWKRNALVRQVRPDVVHLQLLNRFTDLWMMPARPIVATIHDVLPHQRRLPRRAERLLLARLYRSLDSIVVHHPFLGDQLQAEFNIPAERISCIPLPIAPNDRPSGERDPSSPIVLFFGAFRRNKGIQQLCKAIELLGGEDHLRFHFAGRGDTNAEELVRQLARRDARVTADVGYVDNDVKDQLFRAASLVVLPYTTFTSQSAVLGEAYAAGAPVVVADVGALGASVRDDGTGWVLPSNQPHDIAASIRQAFSDRDAWQQRAERCGKVAAARSSSAIAHSYRALYESLPQRGRG